MNPRSVTAHENGLILAINESLIRESLSGKSSDSDFTLFLMDTTVDKIVWRAKIRIILKVIGGTASRVKSATNQILKILQKDGLL